MSILARKMLAFVDGVHSKNRLETPPQRKKISIYEVTDMPTIIGKFSINYEITTPKSCHDVTTPMETWLYLSLAISFKSLYSLNISTFTVP